MTVKNKDIPDSINQWHVEFDPYGFTDDVNWLEKAEKTEDILQLQHVYDDGPIIDVGFYNGIYKLVAVLKDDWDHPLDKFDSTSVQEITKKTYELMTKYENST